MRILYIGFSFTGPAKFTPVGNKPSPPRPAPPPPPPPPNVPVGYPGGRRPSPGPRWV